MHVKTMFSPYVFANAAILGFQIKFLKERAVWEPQLGMWLRRSSENGDQQ